VESLVKEIRNRLVGLSDQSVEKVLHAGSASAIIDRLILG